MQVFNSPGKGELNMARKKAKIVQKQELRQELEKVPEANIKYKDNVFRTLFSNKENLLSLYNALNGKKYSDPDALEIVTLENAIYMGMKNDLAFILDFNIFLWEHQSTYNPNIPLRDLIYIANEYQKYVELNGISLYSRRQQKIPAPRFIVFYNGEKQIGEQMEHRLSDAYENFNGDPELELKVIVININDGHNKALMEQCRKLKEYAQYVARVRKYQKIMPLKAAVERAVKECIEEDILADFLRKNRAEVIAMSIFEYNQKEEEELLRREEYEAGAEMERKNTEKERKRADLEKKRADSAEKRVDSAEKRADSAEKRADSAEKRADLAEQEILRLQEKLALLQSK